MRGQSLKKQVQEEENSKQEKKKSHSPTPKKQCQNENRDPSTPKPTHSKKPRLDNHHSTAEETNYNSSVAKLQIYHTVAMKRMIPPLIAKSTMHPQKTHPIPTTHPINQTKAHSNQQQENNIKQQRE